LPVKNHRHGRLKLKPEIIVMFKFFKLLRRRAASLSTGMPVSPGLAVMPLAAGTVTATVTPNPTPIRWRDSARDAAGPDINY
jgi:hypothetical protein